MPMGLCHFLFNLLKLSNAGSWFCINRNFKQQVIRHFQYNILVRVDIRNKVINYYPHHQIRRRTTETDEQRLEKSEQRKQRQLTGLETVQKASLKFVEVCNSGPGYVCVSCHRLMYRQTVLLFITSKYTRLAKHVLEDICHQPVRKTQGEVWICVTCDRALKRGATPPVQAKFNKLQLQHVPTELSELNKIEVRLISLRIPFMQIIALPRGKQCAIHGPAVNVPTNLSSICTLLPRLPSQSQITPMKLKRRLLYKGYYMYDYVRPEKVQAGLVWLRANNHLYKDIKVNTSWMEVAATDSSDLWSAMQGTTEMSKPVDMPTASGELQCSFSGIASIRHRHGPLS